MSTKNINNIRIFLSHSTQDKEIASDLCNLLKDALRLDPNRIRCSSIDGYRFSGGCQIDEDIREEVLTAEVLIGLISPASMESVYVLFELGARWGAKKPLIPILSPKTKAREIPGPLSGFNALQCDQPAQLHKLVNEVGQQLGINPVSPEYYQIHVDKLCSFYSSQTNTLETISDNAFTFSDNGHLLAIGAHWDDLLLGCLGTMIKLKRIFSFNVDVVLLCNSYPCGYFGDTQQQINERSKEIYKIICEKENFTDLTPKLPEWIGQYTLHDRSFMDHQPYLLSLLRSINMNTNRPYNLILSPPSADRNPDHALTAEATFSIFRNSINLVLEYDIKRYTENPFVSTLCVGLDDQYQLPNGDKETIAERKINLLQEYCRIAKKPGQMTGEYLIENSEHLFSEEALRARMYVNAQDNGKNKRVKYAEIFHGRLEL